MPKSRNRFPILRALFFIMLTSFGLTLRAGETRFQEPPIDLLFTLNRVGQIYTFDVNITEQLTYSIDVRFHLTLPSKWAHFFDKESPADSIRIHEILGGSRKNELGEWIEPGVPAKFRIQIIQKTSKAVILDELIDRPKTSSTYMGRYATLATKNLPIGAYTIRIDYLEGAPELAPLHATILFARAHHGK